MSETLDRLAAELGGRLLARGRMLCAAESCTGGWIGKVMTDIPGSSAWFDRGFVAYSNDAKREMLAVADDSLARFGAVSAEVAAEMALGALAKSRASISVAVTGIAGPDGGSEEKPVGTVYFAWARTGQPVVTQRLQFAGDRNEVRHQTVRVALDRLSELLEEGA